MHKQKEADASQHKLNNKVSGFMHGPRQLGLCQSLPVLVTFWRQNPFRLLHGQPEVNTSPVLRPFQLGQILENPNQNLSIPMI